MSINASEYYKGYRALQHDDGDIEVLDDGELVDAGFRSFGEAEEYIDALEEE